MSAINKIIRLLEDKGFTQKDLTDYLAIDKSTFSQWKNGKSQSYNKYLPEIAQFLGVSVDYIVRDSISFDFSPHEDDDYMLKCPICDYDCTHFIGTKNVKFNTGKSDGIALEFFCESGHTFYMLVESYKGNTYASSRTKAAIPSSSLIITMKAPPFRSLSFVASMKRAIKNTMLSTNMVKSS